MSPESEFERILEEILNRRAAGERPTLEEYIAKYPQFEGALGEQFETLRVLEELMSEEGSAPPPDTILDDYLLLERIGHGGMGVVFLAEQMSLKRNVALKVLDSRLTSSYERLERFRREAEIAAKLRHPNIIAVYGIGESKGYPYFAMEYSRGISLSQLMTDLRKVGIRELASVDLAASIRAAMARRGVADSETDTTVAERQLGYFGMVAKIVAEIADALTYAHSKGIIHRDVKPNNVMIDERLSPQLADFGVAKDLGSQAPTITHEPVGTPYYMSPELITTTISQVDYRTDIYSLGVTLYEMLTLHVPFSGKTSREVQHNILFEPAPPPRRFNPTVPRDLQIIAMKAMEKNPKDRYQSARDMAEDLRRFLRIEPIHAKPPGLVRTVGRFVWQRRVPAGFAAVVLLLGSAGLFGYAEVHAGTMLDQVLAETQRLVTRGELKEAFARFEAAPAAVRSKGAFREALAHATQRNAEEVRRRSESLTQNIDRANQGLEQSWFWAGQDAAALDRLRFDDPQLTESIHDVLGPYRVAIACDAPGAEAFVEDVHAITGEARDFRSLGKLPVNDRLPIGTYRFTIRTDKGYGEFVRAIDREGLSLQATVRPTVEAAQGMVRIPAGIYPIGYEAPGIETREARLRANQPYRVPNKVSVAAFLIDAYPVTNQDYAKYVESVGPAVIATIPGYWIDARCPERHLRKPVLVPWSDAQRYAEWAGKRLPTEDEWEAAGRGPDGRLFPWGDEPADARANMQPIGGKRPPRLELMTEVAGYLTPVDAFPSGATPTGIFDMLGNASEWVWNPWESRSAVPLNAWIRVRGKRAVRGPSYDDVMNIYNNLATRGAAEPTGLLLAGFRCAKTAR